jgi:3-phenylpropionate/cinnamic acid dioxygenase small subunit
MSTELERAPRLMADPDETTAELIRHRAVEQFLVRECELLDDNRLEEWLATLEPDISYRAPVRVTRERTAGPGFSSTSWHFLEDLESLTTRVLRLETEYAWAEDPPSRTRRFVSNVRTNRAEAVNELAVKSNLLLYRGRMDGPESQLLSCERHDRLRGRGGGRWGLAERTILFDHTSLPTHNLAVFL